MRLWPRRKLKRFEGVRDRDFKVEETWPRVLLSERSPVDPVPAENKAASRKGRDGSASAPPASQALSPDGATGLPPGPVAQSEELRVWYNRIVRSRQSHVP